METAFFTHDWFSLDIFSLDILESLAREYGYWAIFFGIMLENTGLPIPGETVTLVGGFLAGSHELRYGWVLGSAIAGAVLGDNFGYWLGFYGGWPLLMRIGNLFRIPETKLLKVRHQFSENADKAVILGRFVALLRIFAGPLAGIARMPYWQFLLCNLLGATLWGAVMVTLSFFVGRLIPLSTLVSWVAQFAILALAIVIGWGILWWWLEHRQPAVNSQK
jgi:membrane protein DedA with SNARE-associated domain